MVEWYNGQYCSNNMILNTYPKAIKGHVLADFLAAHPCSTIPLWRSRAHPVLIPSDLPDDEVMIFEGQRGSKMHLDEASRSKTGERQEDT